MVGSSRRTDSVGDRSYGRPWPGPPWSGPVRHGPPWSAPTQGVSWRVASLEIASRTERKTNRHADSAQEKTGKRHSDRENVRERRRGSLCVGTQWHIIILAAITQLWIEYTNSTIHSYYAFSTNNEEHNAFIYLFIHSSKIPEGQSGHNVLICTWKINRNKSWQINLNYCHIAHR